MVPLFITLEGGEGVGKSTQVEGLVNRLKATGRDALGTREPGGSPWAEKIRTLLLSGAAAPLGTSAEAVLFAAARADHLETIIRPALAQGTSVVCDRFSDSTRAYQGVLGRVEPALLTALQRVAVGPAGPDLTLVLDLSAEIGLARAAARRSGAAQPDRFERQGRDFHDRLRQAFLDIAAAEPDRCTVIDASQTPDRVASAIWAAVEARLPRGAAARDAI